MHRGQTRHDHVAKVRGFNRAASQRIGALNDSYLDRGRPLGEARLLYEMGRGGADVRDLRAKLELDFGYVSRLLRSLEREGLVKARAAADFVVRADEKLTAFSGTTSGDSSSARIVTNADAQAPHAQLSAPALHLPTPRATR